MVPVVNSTLSIFRLLMLLVWLTPVAPWPVALGQPVRLLKQTQQEDLGLVLSYREITAAQGYAGLRKISSFYADRNGRVWIAAEGGLAYFDGQRIATFFSASRDPKAERPFEIFPLDDRYLLISYSYSSRDIHYALSTDLFDIQTGVFKEVPFPGPAKGLIRRTGKRIQLLQVSGTLCWFDRQQQRWIPSEARFPVQAELHTFATLPGGWVTCDAAMELVLYQAGTNPRRLPMRYIPARSALDGSYYPYLYFRRENAHSLGMVQVHPGSAQIDQWVTSFPSNLSANGLEVFFTAQTSEYWVYSREGGVLSGFDLNSRKQTRVFHLGEFIGNRGVTAVATSGSQVFVGTDNERWYWLSSTPLRLQNQWQQVESVRSFYTQGDTLLMGTYSGSYQSLFSNASGFSPPDQISFGFHTPFRPTVIDFRMDAQHRLWLGLSSRVTQTNLRQLNQGIPFFPPNPFGDVWSVEVLADSLVLLGTDAGLYSLHPIKGTWRALGITSKLYGMFPRQGGKWVFYGEEGIGQAQIHGGSILGTVDVFQETKGISCYYVYQESDQIWWVGTQQGLWRFDPKSGRRMADDWLSCFLGLDVYALLPDKQGHFWVSTSDGIFRVDVARKACYRFGALQGLTETECNRNAFTSLPDGSMLFGTVNGVVHIRPNHLQIPSIPPAPQPVIYLDNALVGGGESKKNPIKIPWNTKQLYIAFSSGTLSMADTRYAYRIPEAGTEWKNGKGAVLQLADLPHRKFTLQVFREENGHWIRIPDRHFAPNGLSNSLVLWCLAILLCSSVLVGWFFMRSKKIPSQNTAIGRQSAPPSVQPAALKASALSSSKKTTDTAGAITLRILNDLLEKHYADEQLNVAGFAALLSVSERRLFNIIKTHTGKTPNNFILDFRLQKAYEAIHVNPYKPLVEILYKCGFNTPSYFSRRFQERYGLLPSELQKKLSGQAPSDERSGCEDNP